jgi:hypothetical protein
MNKWPPWATAGNACKTHQTDNCPECETMWNPELVAKLEAERARIRARLNPAPDTREQLEERLRLAKEIARVNWKVR